MIAGVVKGYALKQIAETYFGGGADIMRAYLNMTIVRLEANADKHDEILLDMLKDALREIDNA